MSFGSKPQSQYIPWLDSGDDVKRPRCQNLRTVRAYSVGAGTAGGIARAVLVGSSHAMTTKQCLLPRASKSDSGRRATWGGRRKYHRSAI